MKTIEATVEVGADRRLSLQLPDDVPPGTHRVVVQIDTPVEPGTQPFSSRILKWDVGPWPAGFTLRREDLYDDEI
jgi:hypothetical protein